MKIEKKFKENLLTIKEEWEGNEEEKEKKIEMKKDL